MKDGALQILNREIHINRRLSLSHLPIALIVAVLFAVTGSAMGDLGRFLVLCVSLNIFLSMIYFINVYLQQSKDREMQFLAALPVDKGDVILGKVLYIVLVCLVFNLILHAFMASATRQLIIPLNSLFLSTFVATMMGQLFLAIFLFSSFENLINYSQYIRAVVVLAFIAVIYLGRFNVGALSRLFEFNPVLPMLVYGALTYASYRLMVNRYARRRSYL